MNFSFEEIGDVDLYKGGSIVDLSQIVLVVNGTEIPVWPTTNLYAPLFVQDSSGNLLIKFYARSTVAIGTSFSFTGNFSYSNSFYPDTKGSASLSLSNTVKETTDRHCNFDTGYDVDGMTAYKVTNGVVKDTSGNVICEKQNFGPTIVGIEVDRPNTSEGTVKYEYDGKYHQIMDTSSDYYTVTGNTKEKDPGKYTVYADLKNKWFYWGARGEIKAGSTARWYKNWYIGNAFWDRCDTWFGKSGSGVNLNYYFGFTMELDKAKAIEFTGKAAIAEYTNYNDMAAGTNVSRRTVLTDTTFDTDSTGTYNGQDDTLFCVAGYYYRAHVTVEANTDEGIPAYDSSGESGMWKRFDSNGGAVGVESPQIRGEIGPFTYDGSGHGLTVINTDYCYESGSSISSATMPGTYTIEYIPNRFYWYFNGTDYSRSWTWNWIINRASWEGYDIRVVDHQIYFVLYGPDFLVGTSFTNKLGLYGSSYDYSGEAWAEDSGTVTANYYGNLVLTFSHSLYAGHQYRVHIAMSEDTDDRMEAYNIYTDYVQETGEECYKPSVGSTSLDYTGSTQYLSVTGKSGGGAVTESGSTSGVGPGEFSVSWVPTNNYGYWANTTYDRSKYTVDWTIGNGVSRPSYTDSFTYDGTEHIAVYSNTDYYSRGGTYKATTAGNYVFTCTLNTGCFWVSEESYSQSTAVMKRNWTIEKLYVSLWERHSASGTTVVIRACGFDSCLKGQTATVKGEWGVSQSHDFSISGTIFYDDTYSYSYCILGTATSPSDLTGREDSVWVSITSATGTNFYM